MSKLLEEWVPRVYRFALRLCSDPHVAEDLTQETFLRAWQQRSRLRDEDARTERREEQAVLHPAIIEPIYCDRCDLRPNTSRTS